MIGYSCVICMKVSSTLSIGLSDPMAPDWLTPVTTTLPRAVGSGKSPGRRRPQPAIWRQGPRPPAAKLYRQGNTA